jgi:hypothetical protein
MSFGVEHVIGRFGYPPLPLGVSRDQFETVLFHELKLRPIADWSEARNVYQIAVEEVWLSYYEQQPVGHSVSKATAEDAYDVFCEASSVSRDTQPEKRRTPMCFDLVATDLTDESDADIPN